MCALEDCLRRFEFVVVLSFHAQLTRIGSICARLSQILFARLDR